MTHTTQHINGRRSIRPASLALLIGQACLFWPSSAISHGLMHEEKNLIETFASFHYRSEGTQSDDEAWLLPGFFLGGEATGSEKRFSLDDAFLAFRYGIDDITLFGGLSTHQGHEGVELESLWLSWPVNHWAQLHAGRLSSLIRHWEELTVFSERSLLEQVFFGGHHHDTGARLYLKPTQNFTLGVEAMSGQAWPANRGTTFAFSELKIPMTGIMTKLGVWMGVGRAERRQDERYEGDHHGGIEAPNSDFAFTGDVELAGAYGIVSTTGRIDIDLTAELIVQRHDGRLENIESTHIQQESQGARLAAVLNLAQWSLGLSYQRLHAENTFNGGSQLFLEESRLINNGFEPQRTTLSALIPLSDQLSFRVEIIEDNIGDSDIRAGLGLVWRDEMTLP